jgi:DNA ligase-1
MPNFKPMLAATPKKPEDLRFPYLASPKLDGIRAVVLMAKLYSRHLKLIPNEITQETFGDPRYNGLDGELIVGRPYGDNVFQRTSSGVMTTGMDPQAVLYVFDYVLTPLAPFERRYDRVKELVLRWPHPRIKLVPQKLVHNAEELLEFEEFLLDKGFEGVILRKPDSPYKHGRSTLTENYMLKIKRFVDDEAVVVGFEELMHNDNAATINELGHTKRSSHKANKRGGGTLGKFVCEWKDLTGRVWKLKVGTGIGLTQGLRQEIWDNQRRYKGAVIKFKYLPISMKDVPRHPVWLGFRDRRDM